MTAIEWTHRPGTKGETWNPVVGCDIISPGCTNCYAMKMAARIERMTPGTHYAGTTRTVNGRQEATTAEGRSGKQRTVWTGAIKPAPEKILLAPLRWKSPRTVFVNSMADLFHEAVPDELIDRVFAVMALCPQHTFIVLTKRSARMREYVSDIKTCLPGRSVIQRVAQAAEAFNGQGIVPASLRDRWPLSNVWLGVSAEDQRRADGRIPDLLATPAAVRFVSAEPLLGPIDFSRWIAFLNQIIVGGESGREARPMHPEWARSIRDQCAAAGVAFFFKQNGHWREPLPHERYDTSKGRMASPPAFIVAPDGTVHCFRSDHTKGGVVMLGVGKRAAGATLDGREHREFPA